MKKGISIIFFMVVAATGIYAQEKGVDRQTGNIRDAGNSRAPASNGSKQDVGVGRGIDFGGGKTPTVPLTPNPYKLTGRRNTIVKAIEDLMRDRKLVVDTAASKPDDGILISQPFIFSKGAVVTESELNRYADLPNASSRGWTRGRYTYIVEVQPIDGMNTNVSVNVKLEGRTDGVSGAEWVTLRSNGTAEQEFLNALIENVTGAPATGRTP
ncbi:MAG TPA: hypothetical protein VF528_07205 [Pyrinomonadaceae bacterium]